MLVDVYSWGPDDQRSEAALTNGGAECVYDTHSNLRQNLPVRSGCFPGGAYPSLMEEGTLAVNIGAVTANSRKMAPPTKSDLISAQCDAERF